ncbi:MULTISPECIES: Arc family DNA-binding protein [unclassified Variovorax]|uniref:Arc family DNA-binding protein n=1 Tax=unclassified Variovorax TaxID=663243 RepID=UPI003F484963
MATSYQDDYMKTALRLPRDLHAKIQEAATASGKSLNSELIARLQHASDVPKVLLPMMSQLQYDLAAERVHRHRVQVRLTEICDTVKELGRRSPDMTLEELQKGLQVVIALANDALKKHRGTFSELRDAYREAEEAALDLSSLYSELDAEERQDSLSHAPVPEADEAKRVRSPETIKAAEVMLKGLRAGSASRTRKPEQSEADSAAPGEKRRVLLGPDGPIERKVLTESSQSSSETEPLPIRKVLRRTRNSKG